MGPSSASQQHQQQLQHPFNGQRQSAEIQLRTPHVLPIFSGEAPRSWLLECEDIFNLVQIPMENRVKWCIGHNRGQAKTWLSSSGFHLDKMSWSDLSLVLLERFPDTVNIYIDQYESWMTRMKSSRPYLPPEFFVERFVSGLIEGIKHNVQCQKPHSHLSAYWFVRQYEKAYLSGAKKAINPPPTVRQLPNNPIRNAPAPLPHHIQQNNLVVPIEQRNRARRKCWYCPENWTIGHKCQQMQRALNQIEMQGHSDDENADIPDQPVINQEVPAKPCPRRSCPAGR
jgi:hypothetical protein